MKSENLKTFLGYIVICLVWGSTWMAIRIGLDSMPPLLSAGFRFLLASVFVLIIMRFMGLRIQVDGTSLIIYLVMCIFSYILPFGFVYWGEKYVNSGVASILFASFPLFVAVFSKMAFPKDRIGNFSLIGIIAGFAGIVVIFSNDLSMNLTLNLYGMIVIVLSSLMQAGIAVAIKKYGKHLNPLSMNFIPIFFAGIVLTLVGWMFEDTTSMKIDSKAVFTVTYLALFGTVVAFTTYYWLLKRMSVVFLSLSSFITPIIAVIVGWIFLNEKLSERTLLGSLLVLIGILFANFNGLKNYYYSKFKNG
ncbi:MAG: EamA family transporter [Ignavibacteriales bacterium]|nr:EamA family transporter [Ignavibacteriales bacterium]